MSKGFDIPHNKHLGNSHDYWEAPQKNSKQIVVQPLQWLPIDRDENGYATEECLDRMFKSLPVVLNHATQVRYDTIPYKSAEWRHTVKHSPCYTHYLPIPKLEI